jgi:hypothetical protein
VAAGWVYKYGRSYQPAFAVVAALYVLSAVAMFLTPAPEFATRA